MKQPAETPQTFWQAAMAYAMAVKVLADSDDDPHTKAVSMPALMLVGFVFELAGKSFLLSQGDDLKPGHDLIKLFKRCSDQYGLQLAAEIAVAIEALAPAHRSHSFRYLQPGYSADVPDVKILAPHLIGFVRDIGAIMAGGPTRVPDWLYR